MRRGKEAGLPFEDWGRTRRARGCSVSSVLVLPHLWDKERHLGTAKPACVGSGEIKSSVRLFCEPLLELRDELPWG